jgi:S-adenosylmethionine:tRNA ribosyltransferase-isomerase
MNVSDFGFDLPDELIAQNPVVPRDSARLLVYDRTTGTIEHHQVRDVPHILPARTLFVANDSKVRHGRLHATRANGRDIEVLILEKQGRAYTCLLRGRAIQIGERLRCAFGEATVRERQDLPGMNAYLIEFDTPDVETLLEEHGEVPLPPYIDRSTASASQYQTVYARELGSAAAPTAGLHFTPELLKRLSDEGHEWAQVTLHVGMGTFLPLRDNHLEANRLHREITYVPDETVAAVQKAQADNRRILAVGTTSTRTLESHSNPELAAGNSSTELFIYPGYRFKTVQALMTNFHLPNSSLLALVSAFIGNDVHGELTKSPEEMVAELRRVYAVAIEEQYRFFSFGDSMLIL